MSVEATIRFCKEFLQQLNKYPVEYLEGYVEKRTTKQQKPVISAPVKKPSMASKPSSTSSSSHKVTVKKLGGVAKAHEINLSAGASVGDLRTQVATLFGTPHFTLMHKGRPLADEAAKVTQAIPDPTTPVYVSIKAAPSTPAAAAAVKTGVELPVEFWGELRGLLGKHVATETADKLATRFKQEYPSWS